MPLKALDPVLKENLCAGWDIAATGSGRAANGLRATLVLLNGKVQHSRPIDVYDDSAQEALAQIYATKTGQDLETILDRLRDFILKIESATRQRDSKHPTTLKDQEYREIGEGLWLVKRGEHGEEQIQLTNFTASITADVVEDDGTTETRRFFELEAHHGDLDAGVRVAAKDFQSMTWVAETLGAKARLYPQPFGKEHAAAAIQDLSEGIESRHTYVHTGWRQLGGSWHYLHGAGAITATGETDEVLVSLSETLARYRLPTPPRGAAEQAAIHASLALRTIAPHGVMIPIVANTYLAPLRPLLGGEPPDVTTWVVGPSGQFKSEYAALGLAHYGDFTRLTLPASFVATGNGLERLCHALKDSLLVVDDFYPAGDRRQVDAMNQTAGRLLRGIGNQAGRQRMRQDTSMRTELPPRCLLVATGERLPLGHSTNARIFLVSVPRLQDAERQDWATKLSEAQATRHLLPLAMAGYLCWIATQWDTLATEIPARFHQLRTDAYQAEGHAREPSQVAYLQLGWKLFTRYAEDAGVLTADIRTTLLQETWAVLQSAASEHSQALQAEMTVNRFLALLTDGFASKQIYLRALDDKAPAIPRQWGWSEEMEYDHSVGAKVLVPHERQATLIGYLDTDYLYLLPEATERYLQEASRKAGKVWPVDNTTLLRELADAELIKVSGGDGTRTNRTINKKIVGKATRCIWLKRSALNLPDEAEAQATTPQPTPEPERYPGQEEPEFLLEADDEIPF